MIITPLCVDSRHKKNFLSMDANNERQAMERDEIQLIQHFRGRRGDSYEIRIDCNQRDSARTSSMLSTPQDGKVRTQKDLIIQTLPSRHCSSRIEKPKSPNSPGPMPERKVQKPKPFFGIKFDADEESKNLKNIMIPIGPGNSRSEYCSQLKPAKALG